MAVMRDWITPASATALVAWMMIPLPSVDRTNYDVLAVSQHSVCALQGHITPAPPGVYPPQQFEPLIPSAGGKFRVIDAHECLGSMKFTHLVIESADGHKASVLVTRSGEGGERTVRRRLGDFDVTQVRTTRHRAFVVIERQRARELREWRELTTDRMRQFLRQSEGN